MELHKLLIGGKWVDGSRVRDNINPSDVTEVVGRFTEGGAGEIDAAVAAAGEAAPAWAASGPQQRFDVLDFIGSEILARKQELGLLLAREEGKTLPEAVGEVGRAGQIFKFYAGEALRLRGERIPSTRPGVMVEVTREPLGVVGMITPWNFPIAIPAWKIAPALAFGNTVVLKPAELTPACAWALADIIHRSDLPPGVFNMVNGAGSEAGAALVQHRDVAGISFTGSVETGRGIAAACIGRMAKFQLEMGGKNPLIVLDDADLDTAVACAVNGAFFSTGQRCTASSRLIVTEGIHDRFVNAVSEKIASLVVGDAVASDTQIGPAVDGRQLEKNLAYMDIGRKEGAELVRGGERVTCEKDGFYMSPALFVNTRNDMRINREEIFGPIATVLKAADLEEAMALANDTPFGLSAGICTTSLSAAEHFKANARAGMVMVNLPTAGVDYHVPFGGTKASSYGSREQGSHAAEFYTTVKTAYQLA
ncbi:MAG: aldehyde dehydrogenase family protein [Acidobacteriota bacterium]|nr:aldehyde dehydrogenase family protein [Acidobacteriota bacterium]